MDVPTEKAISHYYPERVEEDEVDQNFVLRNKVLIQDQPIPSQIK